MRQNFGIFKRERGKRCVLSYRKDFLWVKCERIFVGRNFFVSLDRILPT